MVANKLLTELGGQNLSERTDKTALSEDMEETLRTIVNIGSKGMAQMPYNILQDNGSFTNQDYLFADRFTDSTGANDTVITASTTSYFSTNKYICGVSTSGAMSSFGTLHTSTGSWANGSNAIDGNTSTYASAVFSLGGNPNSYAIGATFSSRTIYGYKVKAIVPTQWYSGGSNTSATIKLQTYNGSTWSDYVILATEDNSDAYKFGGGLIIDTFGINKVENCLGIRIAVTTDDTTFNTFYLNVYDLQIDEGGGRTTTINTTIKPLSGSDSTLSLFGKVTPFLYTGTGDGNNDNQNFTPVAGYTSAQTEGGVKVLAKNDILLKKVKLPVYDSAYTGGVVKIYDSAKTLLKTISTTNTVTSGTADGSDDTHTLSGTWGSGGTPTTLNGIRVNAVNSCFVKSVTKEASCTATNAYIIRNNRIIGTATFSGNTATFSPYPFLEKGGVYSVLCGSDGSSHTARQATTPTYTMSADLAQSTTYGNSRGIATYVNATTTSGDNAGTGDNNIMNITSIVTQTASADSTRYVDSGIDVLLKAGRYYYIQESVTAYTNNYVPNFTQTFPDNTPADIKLTGGSYSTSVTDSTAYNFGILGLVTQNITGALTNITNITADVSDGTTTISAQPIDGTPIDITSLGAGELKITFNLTTTDANFSPELFGFGGYIQ